MRVVGVEHSIAHEFHPQTMEYLNSVFHRGSRVAIEWHQPLELLLKNHGRACINSAMHDGTICTFFSDVAKLAHAKGGRAFTVHDKVMSDLEEECYRVRRHVYFNKDTTENRVRNDVAIFQRSMTMYHLAQEGNATDLVTGSTHAYDLKLAGVRNIHFLRFLTPKEQQPRIEAYERWQAQTAGLR